MKMFRVVVNGSEYKVGIEELPEDNSTELTQAVPASTAAQIHPPVQVQQKETHQVPREPEQPVENMNDTAKNVTAPIPGTVISVAVDSGTFVSKGQTLLILEAMKMENEIKTPCDSTVKEVKVSQGTSVNAGDILIVLAP